MARILVQATVEKALDGKTFYVHTWAQPPYDEKRDYVIVAADENTAAFEGIRRLEDELVAKEPSQCQ